MVATRFQLIGGCLRDCLTGAWVMHDTLAHRYPHVESFAVHSGKSEAPVMISIYQGPLGLLWKRDEKKHG